MRPVFVRELDKFGLRPANKPDANGLLSGVVVVAQQGERGYAYVRFSSVLVQAVGRALPRGLTPQDTAYLKVIRCRFTDRFKVYAYYVDQSAAVLLWESAEKPTWLKRVRSYQNGKSSSCADHNGIAGASEALAAA